MSDIPALVLALVCQPATTRIRPSDNVVAFGYQRRYCIFGTDVQLKVVGSKISAFLIPIVVELSPYPPTTRILPSAIRACPEQKRSADWGTLVNVLAI